MLYVATRDAKGRGVYSSKKIQRDQVIERCEVLVIPEAETSLLDSTMLFNYYFCWGDDQNDGAIALGFGSIYNHSYTPNALYRIDLADQVLEFVALRDIPANEEITINYNGAPEDKSPLWNADEIKWIE